MSKSQYVGGESRISCSEIEPAMTFEEIAARLGSSRKSVFMTYKSAIAKLRHRKPETLLKMLELARAKDRGSL